MICDLLLIIIEEGVRGRRLFEEVCVENGEINRILIWNLLNSVFFEGIGGRFFYFRKICF